MNDELTTSEKILMIRLALENRIRFNVDLSFIEHADVPQSEQRGNKTGESWGSKQEYFTGLTEQEKERLFVLLAAHRIKASIRVHQVGTD